MAALMSLARRPRSAARAAPPLVAGARAARSAEVELRRVPRQPVVLRPLGGGLPPTEEVLGEAHRESQARPAALRAPQPAVTRKTRAAAARCWGNAGGEVPFCWPRSPWASGGGDAQPSPAHFGIARSRMAILAVRAEAVSRFESGVPKASRAFGIDNGRGNLEEVGDSAFGVHGQQGRLGAIEGRS